MSAEKDMLELEQRLKKGNYVRPESLSATNINRYRNELQLEFLQDTLMYCAEHVPYYQKRWAELGLSPRDLQSFEDLQSWPLLYKQDIVANRQDIVSQEAHISSFRCTSGTTGRRLALPISQEEVKAINRIGSLRSLTAEKNGTSPFVLQIIPPVRRLSANTGGTGSGPVISTYLNLDASDQRFEFDYVDHIMQCLTESFPNNHGSNYVEVLWTCPTFIIRTLTDMLLQRHFDFSATSVSHLVSSGGIVTQAMCDYVQEHWGAPLSGFYSMAEVVGSHRRCPYTGRYDFDFLAVAEFLNPETKQPVTKDEEGVLVLSSLYPFQQAQPMIRYWTGDIFTLHHESEESGDTKLAGTFRGRQHECINADKVVPGGVSPRIFGSADVLEVLQVIPELPQFHKNPKFNLYTKPGSEAPIVVEVESYPRGSARASALQKRIRNGLAARLKDRHGSPFDPKYIDARLVDKGELQKRQNTAAYYPDR